MTEQELRALVREAIARHVGGAASTGGFRLPPPHEVSVDGRSLRDRRQAEGLPPAHASHGMFRVLDGSQSDGPCIIEPAVMCNHCGYCKSYGH
jgi:hypothetical protein